MRSSYSGATRGGPGTGSPTGYEPAYGGIPNLPPYVTDTASMTGTDVQANLVKNLPGYMGMVGADVGNIQSNLAGALPADVIQQLQQRAAERGIATGAPGSANTSAEYLRALGLTSLQLQQLGHSQLTEAMARTPVQQTQQTSQTRDLGAERAIYASAPVPGAAARQALLNAQMGIATGKQVAGAPNYAAFAGGGGGGGAYNPSRLSAPVGYPNLPTVGRTGYFPDEDILNSISPLMSPAAYSSGMASGVPTGTGYNPTANTYENLYGQPQYYGTQQAGTQPQMSSDDELLNAALDYYDMPFEG